MAEAKPFEEISADLLHFISKAPTPYQASEGMMTALKYAGFQRLSEEEPWHLKKGGRYVVSRGAAMIAFSIPEKETGHFRVWASHNDSPSFKIKDTPELVDTNYVRLSVEAYGGMNMASWLDRPLSPAGRIYVKKEGKIVPVSVDAPHITLLIPSVAIHMNRDINKGYHYNAFKDMDPLFAETGAASFMEGIAKAAKVKKEDILGHDLFLYNREAGLLWGPNHEFISSPRLDDLQCAFAGFRGFAGAAREKNICVYALFNNEEIGSETASGAGSTFLSSVIKRISAALALSYDEMAALTAGSLMISADNAHAVHPNHPEYADPVEKPLLNKGIVLKFNAAGHYTTDGYAAAWFRDLCKEAHAPMQVYSNRADLPGGSTLGHISNTQIAFSTADIGLPQLSMHSSYETAGAKDTMYLLWAANKFFA